MRVKNWIEFIDDGLVYRIVCHHYWISFSFSLSLTYCLSLSLFPSLSLTISLSLSFSLSLSLSFSLSLPLSHQFYLSISIYPNLRLSFSSFLFLHFRFQGFWWSPCSGKIAYTESDESSIPEFVINHQVIEISVLKKSFYSLTISSIFFCFLLFFILNCRAFSSPLILFPFIFI